VPGANPLQVVERKERRLVAKEGFREYLTSPLRSRLQ
jgi:hypothetical protein